MSGFCEWIASALVARPRSEPQIQIPDAVRRIILLPHGHKFATVSRHRNVELTLSVGRHPLMRFEGYQHKVVDIAYLGQGKAMALCLDGSTCLLRISDGFCLARVEFRKRLQDWIGEDQHVYRRTVMEYRMVRQDGVGTGGGDGLWSEAGRPESGTTEDVTREFMKACSLSCYGSHVMVSFPGMHKAQVWNTTTMRLVERVPGQWGNTKCGALSDRFMALGSDLRQIIVYCRGTGRLYYGDYSHIRPVTGLAIWRDGMVSGSEDGSVKVHNLRQKKVIWSVQFAGPVSSVAISGDRRIAYGTHRGGVELFRPPPWVVSLFGPRVW